MMEAIQGFLDFLFGKLGAMGTLFVCAFTWCAYMLRLEQNEHAKTREKNDLLNEKRFLVFEAMVTNMAKVNESLITIKDQLARRR